MINRDTREKPSYFFLGMREVSISKSILGNHSFALSAEKGLYVVLKTPCHVLLQLQD